MKLGFLLFLAALSSASAQYSIDWYKVAGGGGTSTGGVYSVSGTIGQPDAGGPITNGQYSVTGGFWALPTAVQISWSPNTPGFVLQQTSLLSPSNWTNSPSGSANPIVIPASTASKFYRLFKP